MPMLRVRVITPVYNDWVSFSKLLQELDRVAADPSLRLYVSAIDDGSTESAAGSLGPVLSLRHLVGVEIVAVGLCMAADDSDSDAVIVLDADGEDPPDAIPLLLAASNLEEAVSVVAQRRRRRESLAFRISYRAYKSFFLLLTGKTIDFGNFSLHSTKAVQRLTLLPDLWNNLAAAILRSKIPLLSVPVDRGRRYAGTSKMNYISLVVHGFGFISAYADTIFVRLLALSAGLVALTMLSSLVLLILRIFVPKLATPGWATTIVFGLAIITLQLMMTALSSILMLLNNRVQRLIRPRDEWPSYVDSREQLLCEQAQVLPVPPSYIER
jgi:hypothetical protein